VQEEAADEAHAVDGVGALAAGSVGAHPLEDVLASSRDELLGADGGALRVAAQTIEHQRRAGQRRVGVDHPLVARESVPALDALGAGGG
jgi:hypothetical protein